MKFCFSILGYAFFLLVNGCDAPVHELYVSLKATTGEDGKIFTDIDSALEEVIRIRQNDDTDLITIHLEEGEYRLASPIKISPRHGSLKLMGKGSGNTVVKGSKKLEVAWKKYDENIWIAQLDRRDAFDQLFINGEPQILARYPNYNENGGHWQGHAADAISTERVKTWKHPVGAIVHAMHSGEWGDFHYRATGIDEDGQLILVGGHQNNRPSEMHKTYRMVENVFEELDSPGEWFLDSDGKLYYWPVNGINLENAIVEGTVLKGLLEFVGTEENPVKDIALEGIRFEHTQRTFMEVYETLLRSDWTIYRGAAVFLEGTEDISIRDCEFTNLGGNAIFLSDYNRNVSIGDNHIHDCGASGICFVGSPDAVRSPSFQYNEFVPLKDMDTMKGPKTNAYPSECIADNNLIHRIGRIEKQTAGVEIAMAMNITVSNNSIYDVPRAGINIGDGTWGGHLIEYNDVFNTVLESGDHGAFNSWGRDRFWHPNRDTMDLIVARNPEMPKWDAIKTTIIRNNRFRCDHGWDIDLDDGSSNYHIYNNVCLNGGLKLREGFNRTVENNIILNNGFHPHVWFKNSGDVFRHNIVFTEHKDIRLQDWGKEVDYNFYPDTKTLALSQEKGVDTHSGSGDVLFVDAANGNYNIPENSPAVAIGFEPFDTKGFGVKDEKLKGLAKTPEIPKLFFGPETEKSEIFDWLGSKIKTIATLEERSAAGLNKTAGVLIMEIDEEGILKTSGLQAGDVILAGDGNALNNVGDLMKFYQSTNWTGELKLTIFRNQKERTVTLKTK